MSWIDKFKQNLNEFLDNKKQGSAQPRYPKGHPKGGQWRSVGSSDLGVIVPEEKQSISFSSDISSVKKSEFSTWPKGDRRTFAREVFDLLKEDDMLDGLITRDKGELTGVAAYFQDKDEFTGTSYLYVDTVATKRRGYGFAMIKQLCKKAGKTKSEIQLTSTPAAKPFYRKLGFIEVEGDLMKLSTKKVREYAKQ